MALQGRAAIDTVIYRGGDLSFVWVHKFLSAFGSQAVFGAGLLVACGMTMGAIGVLRGRTNFPMTAGRAGATHRPDPAPAAFAQAAAGVGRVPRRAGGGGLRLRHRAGTPGRARLRLPCAGCPAACDGLRIDVVSDTHTGSPRNGIDHLDRWVRGLAASDAPLVLMAGDYVILSVLAGSYVPPDTIAQHLKPLTARKPVYAVLGNHDWWKNGSAVARAFSATGVRMVDNRALPVDVAGCRFWLAGLGDLMEGRPDVSGVFAGIPAGAAVVAGLPTSPRCAAQKLPAAPLLTIAGHTRRADQSVRHVQPAPLPRGFACAAGAYTAKAGARCSSLRHRHQHPADALGRASGNLAADVARRRRPDRATRAAASVSGSLPGARPRP